MQDALGTEFTTWSTTQAFNSGSGWLRFSQEQRQVDINWGLSPLDNLQWLFAVRHYETDVDSDDAITRAVINDINTKVSGVHLGSTLAEDGTPASLLPLLEEHVPWNFVGYLYDNKPYDRV